MGFIAGNIIARLLERSHAIRFLYVQDGVVIGGGFFSGGELPMGRLLIIQRELYSTEQKELGESTTPVCSPSTDESTPAAEPTPSNKVAEESKQDQRNENFLVWVPYTYLAVSFPHLLPPSFSHLLDTATDSLDRKNWKHITCALLTNVSTLRRRSNMSGMPLISVIFLDGTSMRPLIFHRGGVTKFLDVVRKITPMRQCPFSDDFVVYGDYTAAVTGTSAPAACTESPNTVEDPPDGRIHSARPRCSNSTNRVRSSSEDVRREDVRRMLYGPGEVSNGARIRDSIAQRLNQVRAHLLGLPDPFFNTVSSFSSPSSQFMRSDGNDSNNNNNNNNKNSNNNNHNNSDDGNEHDSGNSSTDEVFDLLEELIPIEQQVPRLPEPRNQSMAPPLTAAKWESCFNGEDRQLDANRFEEAKLIAYMGGVEPQIRLEVWCFLLHVYPDVQSSTENQRGMIREKFAQMYGQLTLQWRSIFPEQESHFSAFREIRSSIEKDVVRTDRSHPAYAANDSDKLLMLRHVLMAYALFNFDLGYCQGMSDVLSPIVLLAETEVEAFMCFRCFIEQHCRNNFRHDVRIGMEVQFCALRTLIKFFVPLLFKHLVNQRADDMRFCFRWLLMLFKREFPIDDLMLLWDVIISCPYTPNFELFVASALLKATAEQILAQDLTYDELLKFANSTAGNLNVQRLILLAQEFYDDVASHVIALDSPGTTLGNYRPTLDEILKILEDASN